MDGSFDTLAFDNYYYYRKVCVGFTWLSNFCAKINWELMRAQVVGKYVGMGSSNEVARVRYITQVKARPPTFTVFTTAGDTSSSSPLQSCSRIIHGFKVKGLQLDSHRNMSTWTA